MVEQFSSLQIFLSRFLMGTSHAKIILRSANHHVIVTDNDFLGNETMFSMNKVNESHLVPIRYNFTVRVMDNKTNMECARRAISSCSADVWLEIKGGIIEERLLTGPIKNGGMAVMKRD